MVRGAKAVALSLLRDISRGLSFRTNQTISIESGTVIRYIGSSPHPNGEPSKDTASVTFFSMPYLELCMLEPKAAADGTRAGKPLLYNRYGYSVSTDRELNRVVQKVWGLRRREALHVPQVWCPLVGFS